MKKVGIVITYYQKFDKFIIPCLRSVLQHTPHPYYIAAFENNSPLDDKERIPRLFKKKWYEFWKKSDIDFFKISNDLDFGGLTGTWNAGIRQCLEVKDCDIVIVMNDDIIVNKTWKHFVKNISGNTVYGPLSNHPSLNRRCPQTAPVNGTIDKIVECDSVNGFCMGFTREALLNNMYDERYFFCPSSRYMWCDNEGEWQNRLKAKGIQPRIIRSAWVYHYKDQSWHAKHKYGHRSLPANVREQLKNQS